MAEDLLSTQPDASLILPLVGSALLLIVIGTAIGLTRFYFVGTKKESYDTLKPGQPHGPRWYASLNRVYINGIEAFALFIPAVILHMVYETAMMSTMVTVAWIFLLARLVYSLVYVAGGYKIWCSFIWLVGFAATIFAWVALLF